MPRFVDMEWSPGNLHYAPYHLIIMAKCLKCGEQREFNRNVLPDRLRTAGVEDIEKLLKCSSCGVKSGKLLFGYFVAEAE